VNASGWFFCQEKGERRYEETAFTVTEPVTDNAHEQKHIIFEPIPRVEGIDPSEDPLIELRAAIYLLSGRRRRGASEG